MKYIVAQEEYYENGYPIGVFDNYETAEERVYEIMSGELFSSLLVIYSIEENKIVNNIWEQGKVFEKDEDGTISSNYRQE